MAKFYKNEFLNNDNYPLPNQPLAWDGLASTDASLRPVNPSTAETVSLPRVNRSDVERANAELHDVVGLVGQLRPAVEQVMQALQHDAREQGFREGTQQAQEQVRQQLAEAMTTLTDSQRARHQHAVDHAGALAELALNIARKVIGAHLQADPALINTIVAESIAALEPTVKLAVRLNPDDLPLVEGHRAELERIAAGPGSIELVADATVERGGVVLVSPVGEVDARISTKLNVLQTAFAAQRRQIDAEEGIQ